MLQEPNILFFDVPITGGQGSNKLAVHEWGSAASAKSTVFCVHGLTRNGRDFDVLANALSENYRVLSIDVAGRGKSQWHSDGVYYNYPSYVADIGFVIAQLGLTRIHWIGTSMGGIIGMMMANHFPKLLQTLTLNDIGCMIPAAGLNRIAKYVSALTNFETRALAEAELRIRCEPYGISSEEHWQDLFRHSIAETDDGKFRLAYDPAISKNLTVAPDTPIQDINLWPLWEAVKAVPTMLIRGIKSDLLTHETAIQMKESHPDFALLEIENVGHAPALMDELQINTISNWLGSKN